MVVVAVLGGCVHARGTASPVFAQAATSAPDHARGPLRFASPPRGASLGDQLCLLDSSGGVHCARTARDHGVVRWQRLPLPGPAHEVVLLERGGCVLLESGRLACWGHGWSDCPNPETLRLLAEPRGVIRLSSSPSSVLAVLRDASVHRWAARIVRFEGSIEEGWLQGARPPPGLMHSVVRHRSPPSSLAEWFGACVVDSEGGLDCAGEGLGGTSDVEPRAGVRAVTSAAGRLCSLDDDGSVSCWELEDSTVARRARWSWHRRLAGPVLALAAGDGAFCAIRPRDVACLRLRAQAGLSTEAAGLETTPPRGDRFFSLPRPAEAEVLVLGRRVCLATEPGHLACPPELAALLRPVWAVDTLVPDEAEGDPAVD